MSWAESWVERACAGEGQKREELRRSHVEDGVTVATDGIRLHAANIGKDYVDYRKPIRKAAGEDGVAVYVDPYLLADALPDEHRHNGAIVLRIVESCDAIEIGWRDLDDVRRYALIATVDRGALGTPAKIPWRPLNEEAEDEEE